MIKLTYGNMTKFTDIVNFPTVLRAMHPGSG